MQRAAADRRLPAAALFSARALAPLGRRADPCRGLGAACGVPPSGSCDPAIPAGRTEMLLAALFGLTPAEARLAGAM